jgi:hypothetical protein
MYCTSDLGMVVAVWQRYMPFSFFPLLDGNVRISLHFVVVLPRWKLASLQIFKHRHHFGMRVAVCRVMLKMEREYSGITLCTHHGGSKRFQFRICISLIRQ